MNDIQNTIIIGSGPAGLTAGIYASRAEIKPMLIAGLNPGGQLMQTTEVENFPGFKDGIQGPELMQNMISQAMRFGTKIVHENVESLDLSQKPFTVKTDKAEYKTHTIILAMGADANWLNLPSEQRLRGKGVSACATCDGFFFKNKHVVVVGGGDAAMEEAIFLTKYASKVTMLHRSESYKASKIMLARAQANPKIEFKHNVQVVEVIGADRVEAVKLKNTINGAEDVFACDGMFVAIGHTPNSSILKQKVKLDEKGYAEVENHTHVIVSEDTHTNVEGVFVAGDLSDPRYRQAVTAAGMGAIRCGQHPGNRRGSL